MDILYVVTTFLFAGSTVSRLIFSAKLLHNSRYKISLLIPTVKEIKLSLAEVIVLTIKIFSLIIYFFVTGSDIFVNFYHILITIIFLSDSVLFFYQFKKNEKNLSFLTSRECLIGIATFIVILILYMNALVDQYFWLLIIDRLILAIYFFFVFILSFPFEINEDIRSENIKKHRDNYRNLFPIIFYGKESKAAGDLLQQILIRNNISLTKRQSFCSTSQLTNSFKKVIINDTQVGIFDLQTANDEFIESIEIIKPRICVINDITDKSGSNNLANIISGAINNFSTEGIFILNADIEKSKMKMKRLIKMICKSNRQIVVYTSRHDVKDFKNINNISFYSCSELKEDTDSRYFTIRVEGKSYYLSSPRVDNKYMNIIIPAILTIRYMNYSMKEAVRLVSKV